MNKKVKEIALEIKNVIKEENIISFTNCMTRLRIKAKPNFNIDELKKINGVLGLVIAGNDEFQIILGPGTVNKVALEFEKIVNIKKSQFVDSLDINTIKTAEELGKENKQKFRKKGKVSNFLSKVSKVFSPLIPAFIGAGILAGIAGILASSVDNNFTNHETLKSWYTGLNVLLSILTSVFVIAVGWRMGEEWGGNPGICALTAAIYSGFAGAAISAIFIPNADGTYNLFGITIENIEKNWFSVGFLNYTTDGTPVLGAPHAGLIGAMIAVGFTIYIEKFFRKFMPGAIDTIVTPIIVLFLMIGLNIILIIPIAGYLFTGISFLFENLYRNPFGAAFLAGIFLFALTFGVHQGFLPIYFALIDSTGVNGLFPILAMAGCAQVGVSIMMFLLAKKGSTLRKQISGAIIPGFLGIGEPLIYGISLPRVKPFVIACFAAAFGGFYIGALNTWAGIDLGMNAATGPGGLTATIMMTTADGNVALGIGIYLSAVLLTYVIGALFCWFGYSKIARNGWDKTKILFSKKQNNLKLKILYFIVFITIIGIFISWIVWYFNLENNQKKELKNFELT